MLKDLLTIVGICVVTPCVMIGLILTIEYVIDKVLGGK